VSLLLTGRGAVILIQGIVSLDSSRLWKGELVLLRQPRQRVSPAFRITCSSPVDGLILSPTAHDHSLNYRSATVHLHSPLILDSTDPEQHEEKRNSLAEVTNTVTAYSRTTYVGEPVDPNVTNTTVIRCKIRSVSCKQRYGGFDSCKEPELRDAADQGEKAFQGVAPCWTAWGKPLGFGKDREMVEGHFEKWGRENREFAEKTAWGSEDVRLEGIGKKR